MEAAKRWTKEKMAKMTPKYVTKQTELGQEHRKDQSLMRARSAVEKGEEGYLLEDGLLYHRSKKETGKEVLKLVLPTHKRKQVIMIAHSISLAGHFCWKNTFQCHLRFLFVAMASQGCS